MVDVEVEAALLGVEVLGPVDVGDRQQDDLELVVDDRCSTRPSAS
jgi:hypothetical protein